MGRQKKAVLLNNTIGEKHVGCTLVINNLQKICEERGVTITKTYTRKDLLHPGLKKEIDSSEVDLIIVNGEGTLHHSPQASSSLLSIRSKKPKILVNAVWEKMYCCSNFLNSFDFISVRESKSYAEICKSVDKSKVEVIPDLIFYDSKKLKTSYSVGYSDSVMTHVCDELVKRTNFFPMLQSVHQPDPASYIAWMKSLDLYVTGRFHGVCLAIILNVPFLAFPSNSHKIEGILDDCGCPELLISELSRVEEKRELAVKALERTRVYAEDAHKKIFQFYDKVLRI